MIGVLLYLNRCYLNYFCKSCMNTYQFLSLLIASIGLIGLFYYVIETNKIAKATVNHNDIITRPVITVKLNPLIPNGANAYKLDHIGLLIENHTSIHANIKVHIKYEVIEKLKDVTVKISTPISVKKCNGKSVWNVSAKDKIIGHTGLDKLKGRTFKTNELVILEIETLVSPYGKNDYRSNPLVQYQWDDSYKVWIPNLVLKA